MTNSVVRYSDAELAEFQALIEKKLEKSREQLESLQEQILEITENSSDEHGGDWVDDSSINNDVEMLNNMAIRQRMYIQDLENALVRIRNKTYGICSVTGELIDKRRLMAVPTTTKSLAAKTEQQAAQQPQAPQQQSAEDKPAIQRAPRPVAPKPPANPKVITKIIRKPTTPSKPKPSSFDEDDDDLFESDLFFDDDDDPIRRAVNDMDDVPEGIEANNEDTDDVDVDMDVELDMDMDIEDMDIDLDKDIDGADDDGGEDDKEFDF